MPVAPPGLKEDGKLEAWSIKQSTWLLKSMVWTCLRPLPLPPEQRPMEFPNNAVLESPWRELVRHSHREHLCLEYRLATCITLALFFLDVGGRTIKSYEKKATRGTHMIAPYQTDVHRMLSIVTRAVQRAIAGAAGEAAGWRKGDEDEMSSQRDVVAMALASYVPNREPVS
ncbi:hypothetical protein BJX62DRAFT_237118 [Aspergillus germanicus]